MAALSLRSFDGRRQYPADVAGYYSRCPSGKFKFIRFISALFLLNYLSQSDGYFSPAKSAGLNVCGRRGMSAVILSKILATNVHEF